MNSKQRAHLIKLSHDLNPIFNIGKDALSPELTEGIGEALKKRELIKVQVLNNCMEDIKTIARKLSERTRSQVVTVIGKKIVLYKTSNENKIKLPK